MKYDALFEKIKIGNKYAKNRIVLPPMILGEATPEGFVTQNMIDRYRHIAEGGIGMMVIEGVAVNTPGSKGIGGLFACNNNIQGLERISNATKLNNVLTVMQVLHCGRQALPEANDGVQPISVSDIPYWMGKKFAPTPRPATLDELEEIKQEFVNAALLAHQADFDGIEVHCAHGYLLATFLSKAANTRTDKYGGSFENRMKYPLEVVKAIREATDPNFVVGARISANYMIPNEPTLDDMRIFAKELEKVGVDYISVSGGTYESHWKQSPPCYVDRNINGNESHVIKNDVNVPVLVAGGICYPEEANELVASDKTDLVCMGRAIFADPELPNKLLYGKEEEIRPCIRCNLEFADTFKQHQARCSVNFQMGREKEYEIRQAREKKSVMIVGGGPGGMEAARVAALRGHKVDLFEKDSDLGGNLIVASAPPHKEEIRRLISYFKNQMKNENIQLHMGVEVDNALIEEIVPDALVIAVGATPLIPPIPGIDRSSVLLGEDVLNHKVEVGDVAVVAGAGCVGIDLVLQLTEEGKKVILVDMADSFGKDLDVISWSAVDVKFKELIYQGQLELRLNTKVIEILDDSITLEDKDGVTKLEIKNLILALGYKPNDELAESLSNSVVENYTVGDAIQARRIRQAIHEGFIAGYRI